MSTCRIGHGRYVCSSFLCRANHFTIFKGSLLLMVLRGLHFQVPKKSPYHWQRQTSKDGSVYMLAEVAGQFHAKHACLLPYTHPHSQSAYAHTHTCHSQSVYAHTVSQHMCTHTHTCKPGKFKDGTLPGSTFLEAAHMPLQKYGDQMLLTPSFLPFRNVRLNGFI